MEFTTLKTSNEGWLFQRWYEKRQATTNIFRDNRYLLIVDDGDDDNDDDDDADD